MSSLSSIYKMTGYRLDDGTFIPEFISVARVKKILAADDEIQNVSNNAAFVITVATEMFVQYLVKQVHNVVTTDRGKQRRTIQYRDVANAVARIDNLEFLSDVVPKTMTLKQARALIAAEEEANTGGVPVNLTAGLNAGSAVGGGVEEDDADVDGGPPNGHATANDEDDTMEVDEAPNGQQQVELQLRSPGPRANGNGEGGVPL